MTEDVLIEATLSATQFVNGNGQKRQVAVQSKFNDTTGH